MVKPAEEIESIKIHQVSGLGGNIGGSGDSAQVGVGTPVTQAVDAIGSMAFQLPALKKLGEEVGISLDSGLAGIMSDDVPQVDTPAALTSPNATGSEAASVQNGCTSK